MKTIGPVILGGMWDAVEQVIPSFTANHYNHSTGEYERDTLDDEADIEILLGFYECECYEGTAFVLYRSKASGKLYTVQGSHCSCYGLEGQWWCPVEVTVASLRHELDNGRLGVNYANENLYATELRSVLDQLEASDEARS